MHNNRGTRIENNHSLGIILFYIIVYAVLIIFEKRINNAGISVYLNFIRIPVIPKNCLYKTPGRK